MTSQRDNLHPTDLRQNLMLHCCFLFLNVTKIPLEISVPLRPMFPQSLGRSLPKPASVNSPLLKFSLKSQMVHSVSLEKHGWTDSGTARISNLYAWGSWGREEVRK